MKRLIPLVFAGFIGGMVSFFSFQIYTEKDQANKEFNQSPYAVLTSNNNADTPFNFVEAARKVTPAVVQISATESNSLAQQRFENQKRKQPRFESFFDFWDAEELFGRNFYTPKNGTGSGVIVSKDGYIVTNNHVVEYADIIKVSLSDKREFSAIKIGTNPTTDLALLKIEASDLSVVEFEDSDKINVGEWVAAIGNPFSYLTSTVTAGIISAKGRDLDIIQGEKTIEEFIQTDAAINPGNSGGALVNTEGKLIGINTAIATPTGVYAGYSFAIPSNLVKRVIKDIKENGTRPKGRLGIQGNTVNKELKEAHGLGIERGFYIEKVDQGSAAQFAGVLPGDIVLKLNEQRINNFEDLAKEMEFAKVGDTVKLVVLRKNKEIKIPVRISKGI